MQIENKSHKKICVIYNGLPNSGFGGGSDQALYNLLNGLIKYNCKIYCIGTKGIRYPKSVYDDLKRLNIKFTNKKLIINKPFASKLQKTFYQHFNRYFYDGHLSKAGMQFKKKKIFSNFDGIIIFGDENIKYFSGLNKNTVGILSDHYPSIKIERNILNENTSLIKKKIRDYFLKIYYFNFNKSIIDSCRTLKKVYTFSYKEYLNYKKTKFKKINYLKLPIKIKKIKKINNIKIKKVALTSHYYYQDLTGLYNLYRYIIPKLKQQRTNHLYKFYLIMQFDNKIPTFLKKLINEKNVFKRKFSEKCLNDIDLLLYPNNYSVGVRSKILNAFANKILVYTTIQSKRGIPELKNFNNCILANDYKDLIEKVTKLSTLNIQKISKMQKNAYNLINQNYNYIKISKKIIDTINKF